MITGQVTLKIERYRGPHYEEEIRLRRKILRIPLGLDYTAAQLEAEKEEIRIYAFHNDELCGCLLMKDIGDKTFQMRQFAVDEHAQGKGVGKMLAATAEKFTVNTGYERIILHAREAVIPFYEKLGYRITSDRYFEVGLPHFTMEKDFQSSAG